jgi:hypothetical protein
MERKSKTADQKQATLPWGNSWEGFFALCQEWATIARQRRAAQQRVPDQEPTLEAQNQPAGERSKETERS